MKKTHLPHRLLALLLVAALMFGFAVPVGAADNSGSNVSFRQVDNSAVSVETREPMAEEETTQSEYADTDMVRVSIFLTEKSTVAAGFSTQEIAADAEAMSYREGLQATQESLTASIERVTGEELDVVWNMTLAANAISANVEYGQIAAIEELPGVEKVVLETRYEPQESVTSAENQPNMVVSSRMTGTNVAWQAGYTGAGMRVAVIDTGLDIDHQSVDPDALAVALEENAEAAGMSTEAYLSSLDLLDAEEIAQVLPQLNAAQRYQGLSAEDLYVNLKTPFGFNYIDGSLDITHDNDSEGGHGSHVAGIAVANRYVEQNGEYVDAADSVYMLGNAPDAQIIVMKVFGKNGGAYDSDYMAAIEDAILLGCDTVNLSLGSSRAGEPRNDTYADLLDSLSRTDTVVITSMGNNGAWADYADFLPYLYLDDVNTLTGGSPGTYANVLAVASVENDGVVSSCITVDGTDLIYMEDTTYGNKPLATLDTSADGSGTEYDYVFIEGAGNAADFEGIDVTGKVVFCSRGEIELYKKATNAVKAGAIATILCNNEPGVFYADLYYYARRYGYTQPAVSSTQSAAEFIRENAEQHSTGDGRTYYTGKVIIGSGCASDYYDSDSYNMSDYSSWGVPGDLTLKPEITAPGGNVYSIDGETAETNQYTLMSGTSMAAPQVSGITALVKQVIETKGLSQSGLTDRALAQSVLMSTATPLKDADGEYYPVIQQGAGLANAAAATSFDSYILVDGQPDGKVKAELGDDPDRTGVYSFSFDIHNVTGEARDYTLTADVFTQNFFEYYANYNAEYYDRDYQNTLYMDKQTRPLDAAVSWTADGLPVSSAGALDKCDFDGDGQVTAADGQALLDYVTGARESIEALDQADLDGDGDVDTYDVHLFLTRQGTDTVTVPAGGTVKVSVTIRLTAAAKALLDENYINGAYIQAYVYANAASDEEGVLGTSHSIPMLAFYGNWSDASMFDQGIQQTYETGEKGYAAGAQGSDAQAPYLYYRDINTFLTIYADDPYSTYAFGGNPVVPDEYYMPERNAMNSENGDRVTKVKAVVIRNATASRFTVVDTDSGEVLKNTDLGTIYASYFSRQAYEPLSYTFQTGWTPKGLEEGTHLELSLTLAPAYYVNEDGSVRWDELGKGASLTTPVVIDNTAPTIESIHLDVINNTLNVTASDNQYVSSVSLFNASGVKLLAQTGSITDIQAGESGEFVLDVSAVDGDKFLVQVTDYALNTVTYEIRVDLGEITVPARIAFDLSYGYWVGYDQSSKWPLKSWMPSSETFYAGTWIDHTILASTNEGDLYVMPETDPSDMTYVSNMGVVLTDMAYNRADGLVYGVAENKLVTVDRYNGRVTEVGEIGITTNSLACDENGTFYSHELGTGKVYSYTLETMDAPALLADVSRNSLYIQGMEIDPNTGMLCWNTYRVEYYGDWVVTYGYYWEINTETGEYTKIADFWDNLSCLIIPERSEAGGVTEPVDIVDGISLSRTELDLLPGNSAKISANITPWNASDRSVTWSSSDPAVATVSEDGVVTGVGVGSCTVTATSNLDSSFTASCAVKVDTVKTTLEGILMDENGQARRFTWNTETGSGWTAGAELEIDMIAATYDTDRETMYVMDGNCINYAVDPDTGKVTENAETTLDVPYWDMAYSPVFSTEETPMVSAIWGGVLLTPHDPMHPSGLGFNLASRLSEAGASDMAAITSLGYESYYVEASAAWVDAEHLVLLDNAGNVWNFWVYDNGKGGMSAMTDYVPSTLCLLDFPGVSGLLFCSMTAGDDGYLYLSYFTGETCQLYRLGYDSTEKMYKADLLGEFGDGIWPAAVYSATSNAATASQEGFLPTGNEVELQAVNVDAELMSAPVGPTGSLNSVPGDRTVSPASVEQEGGCDSGTVTLTLTADTDTTNGLITVAYDATALTLTEMSGKTELSSFSQADGLVTFGYASTDALPEGSVLATLTFEPADGAASDVTVTKAQENEEHPGTSETVTLSASGHDYAVTVVSATCTTGGYTLYTCRSCGDSFRTGETAALGHQWGEWTVETAAGCANEGTEIRVCGRCGETETRSIPAGSADCPSAAFSDLNTGLWYHEGVDYVLSNGLMQGLGGGIFAPDGTVTRGMIATILYRMAGESEVKTSSPFTDVEEGKYYADAVAWAYENGIVMGISSDLFAPNATATREQLAALLYRYAVFAGMDVSARGSLDGFTDSASVSGYAREAMAWAVGGGLLVGDSGRLLPGDNATRAQLATIIFRFLEG